MTTDLFHDFCDRSIESKLKITPQLRLLEVERGYKTEEEKQAIPFELVGI